MSAFVVDHAHIDLLLHAGLALTSHGPANWQDPAMTADPDYAEMFQPGAPWGTAAIELADRYRRELTAQTADRVGAMLLAENARSVGHRYDEDELAVELDQAGLYRYQPLPGDPHPLLVLRAINGLAYQSCEHPGWPDSEAKAFLDHLQARTITVLPGYDEAPGWAVYDRALAGSWRP